MDRAIAADPGSPEYRLTRAGAEMGRATPDEAVARREYETAIAMNPNDLQVQMAYAELLDSRWKDPAEARKVYETILKKNEEYDLTEPRRLSADVLEKIRQRLGGSTN